MKYVNNMPYTLEEIPEVAKEIMAYSTHHIFLFYGEMGVGKTTLIKALIKQFGVTDTVQSPTFSLVNEYCDLDNELLYHFDFYRILCEEEAMDIGIEEYLYSSRPCFIEWPEKIESLIPPHAAKIHIALTDTGDRTVTLQN